MTCGRMATVVKLAWPHKADQASNLETKCLPVCCMGGTEGQVTRVVDCGKMRSRVCMELVRNLERSLGC